MRYLSSTAKLYGDQGPIPLAIPHSRSCDERPDSGFSLKVTCTCPIWSRLTGRALKYEATLVLAWLRTVPSYSV